MDLARRVYRPAGSKGPEIVFGSLSSRNLRDALLFAAGGQEPPKPAKGKGKKRVDPRTEPKPPEVDRELAGFARAALCIRETHRIEIDGKPLVWADLPIEEQVEILQRHFPEQWLSEIFRRARGEEDLTPEEERGA